MKGDRNNPASRILRERALKILRDTRAGIDPHFLAAMKERFSAFVPDEMKPADMPLSAKSAAQPAPAVKPAPAVPPRKEAVPAGSEAVDREKVAQIVMEYMKNREDKGRH
ncbi:MAG: hypothetical protein DI626_08455 [Micavibrio aeruginosavorus]|uniref:Uncharacterized protein n=1 Tax=Micavibrio aeruginosavorus TaxID=349221 RepID=A0A2W4ZVC6_9BACT|nr:MAG: hypothetical protein DI626_08455 [Micavibrio aeruginosavorus]